MAAGWLLRRAARRADGPVAGGPGQPSSGTYLLGSVLPLAYVGVMLALAPRRAEPALTGARVTGEEESMVRVTIALHQMAWQRMAGDSARVAIRRAQDCLARHAKANGSFPATLDALASADGGGAPCLDSAIARGELGSWRLQYARTPEGADSAHAFWLLATPAIDSADTDKVFYGDERGVVYMVYHPRGRNTPDAPPAPRVPMTLGIMESPIRLVRNLSKTYPKGVRALDDVSLVIPPGMFGLLGPNGAGQSSLMRAIATLQQPDSGSIRLGDIDVLKQPDAVRRALGYLPQEFGLYPNLRSEMVLDHLRCLRG